MEIGSRASPAGGFAGNLTIVPADHPNPQPGAILLDPSVVFGDGSTHTLRCLGLLQSIIGNNEIKSVLDLGPVQDTRTGCGRHGCAEDRGRRSKSIPFRPQEQCAIMVCRNGKGPPRRSSLVSGRSFRSGCCEPPFRVLRDIVQLRQASPQVLDRVGNKQEQAEILKARCTTTDSNPEEFYDIPGNLFGERMPSHTK